jgi:predicted DNA-binding transcriptional regulator YafY
LTVLYDKPGAASERRRITASLLFEVDGYESTYLEAWDHDKQAWRHFNTDRLAPLLDRTGRRLEEIADDRRRAAEERRFSAWMLPPPC